jgi:hypothetical protein
MKHIKIYESRYQKDSPKRYATASYLEEEQPISKINGFIECLYGENYEFSFYFNLWTDEESFEDFYKFLDDNELEIKEEKVVTNGEFGKIKIYEITVKLSQYKINKYAKLYNDIKKYNL